MRPTPRMLRLTNRLTAARYLEASRYESHLARERQQATLRHVHPRALRASQ